MLVCNLWRSYTVLSQIKIKIKTLDTFKPPGIEKTQEWETNNVIIIETECFGL